MRLRKPAEAAEAVEAAKTEETVEEVLRVIPTALFDMRFLLGLVYERMLGRERAGMYSLGYCERNCRRLHLPTAEEVRRASLGVIGKWRVR